MEEFLRWKLFWSRKTKHNLQMLSRKCCFPKATSRTAWISVWGLSYGCEWEDHDDEGIRYSTYVPHLNLSLWYSYTPAMSPWNPQETNFPGTKFLHLCLPSFVNRMTPGHALPRAVCFWMLYWIALRASLEKMFELWRPSHFPCRLFSSESFHSHTEWEMAFEQRRSNDAFISETLTERWTACGGNGSLHWCTEALKQGPHTLKSNFAIKYTRSRIE